MLTRPKKLAIFESIEKIKIGNSRMRTQELKKNPLARDIKFISFNYSSAILNYLSQNPV